MMGQGDRMNTLASGSLVCDLFFLVVVGGGENRSSVDERSIGEL
jgi:hypothetical protein